MKDISRPFRLLFLTIAVCASALLAAEPQARFALILSDPPAAKSMRAGSRRDALEVVSARNNIRAKQAALRSVIEKGGYRVTGSTSTLLNAVFVSAKLSDARALRALPGVAAVFPLRIQKLELNAAVNLIDAPAAWSQLGGIPNAGLGVKIGIIDTGIDQNHPAFQDSTLSPVPNFPPSGVLFNEPNQPAFTNSKVIVARSYVPLETQIFGDGPAYSTPDDTSPVDRVGHGTAVAMCAGGNTVYPPLAPAGMNGLAPKAYLGNYKVFGSPGILDGATTDALMEAIEDAFNDGMDIVNISSGAPGFSGPLDTGSFCQTRFGSDQCDPEAIEVEAAIQAGMVVVTAAGNAGADGKFHSDTHTYNTIGSPAYAPDAIAVGATGNSHEVAQSVQISGPNLPSNLANIAAMSDELTYLLDSISAPLVDVATVSVDAFACAELPTKSLAGDIALIERGPTTQPCSFDTKLENATAAGAVAVLFYNDGLLPDLFPPDVNDIFTVPSYLIGTSDGQAVKAYVDANAGVSATLVAGSSSFIPAPDTDQVAGFSSLGPALGFGLKPDVAAPGENIYMAAQSIDPNGELYDPSGYTINSGTSFSSPIVAGVAAMVRQSHPFYTPAQIKSAIVNTATADTTDPHINANVPSSVLAVGGGKVEALHAVQSNVTVEPATISFGSLTGAVAVTQALTVTNLGSNPLAVSVARTNADPATQLTVDNTTLSTGVSTLNVTLSGTKPSPGIYQGSITITGGAQDIHVPFLYVVGDLVPYDVILLAGDQNDGTVGQTIPDGYAAFQVIDQYGVPIPNLPVTWASLGGNGSSVTNSDSQTDQYGQAFATITLGTVPTIYTYRATITGLNQNGRDFVTFTDYADLPPTINTGGVVNAASNAIGQGIAPGSYVSIYGTGLAFFDFPAYYTPFPISILGTSVGFDSPGVSVPGALSFVSDQQINVQVPWELAGQTSTQVKVYIEPRLGNVVSVPVATYSPAIFLVNGIAAAVNVNDGSVVSATNPATRGQYVSLYCNGLGPVSNQPATGQVSPSNPLAQTLTSPMVTISGQPATVEFSGLAPGYVGLYQLNVLVPANIAVGAQPVTLTIGGVSAPILNLPVQ